MHSDYPLRLLLVDDQPLVLSGLLAILDASNFSCRTAADGFEALKALRQTLPDVIIADLGMPEMSGFELLSIVRQRFPQIAVIVLSGEYIVDIEESGSLTHAFFQKGQYLPEELIAKIYELHREWPSRSLKPKLQHPPIWVRDLDRKYLVATCSDCLRSFPIEDAALAQSGVNETPCPSCGVELNYVIDNVERDAMEQVQQLSASEGYSIS